MNLIYVYDSKYNKLGEFYSANGYGLKCICCVTSVDPADLPPELSALAKKYKRVTVKRMN